MGRSESAVLALFLVAPYPSQEVTLSRLSLFLSSSDDREVAPTLGGPLLNIGRFLAKRPRAWKLLRVEVGLGALLDSARAGIVRELILGTGSLGGLAERTEREVEVVLESNNRDGVGLAGAGGSLK